ncbi:MAG: Synechococcus phage [Pseudomonadota bacterium]|jgi:hypothetical protein
MKIQGIGLPFNENHSSCGTLKPKTFQWSSQEQEIKVFIDQQIINGLDGVRNKFGWICESKSILWWVSNNIKEDYLKYKESYIKIFTCDQELINLDSNLFEFCYAGSNLPWTPIDNYGIHTKYKNISFLCSNLNYTEGHKYRIYWANKLKDNVDLYGSIINKTIGHNYHESYHHKPKTDALQEYRFSFIFENGKYNSYFTEKITDCFANGVIPIYYGTDSINNFFDINGIIIFNENLNLNEFNEELYFSKIEGIKNNFEIVKNLKMSDEMLFEKILKYI